MNTRSKTRQLLHICTFKPPTTWAGMSERGDTDCAFEMRNGVQELEFVFDFDNASECWKANKKSIGNGCYTYICGAVLKTGGGGGGGVCQRSPMKCSDFCSVHSKKK